MWNKSDIKLKFPKLWTSNCWGITYSFFFIPTHKMSQKVSVNVFKIKRVLNVATGQKQQKASYI